MLLLLTDFNVQTHLPSGLTSSTNVAVKKTSHFKEIWPKETINSLVHWNPDGPLMPGLVSIFELLFFQNNWFRFFFQGPNLKFLLVWEWPVNNHWFCFGSGILMDQNCEKCCYSRHARIFNFAFLFCFTCFNFPSRSQSRVFLIEANYLSRNIIKFVR